MGIPLFLADWAAYPHDSGYTSMTECEAEHNTQLLVLRYRFPVTKATVQNRQGHFYGSTIV